MTNISIKADDFFATTKFGQSYLSRHLILSGSSNSEEKETKGKKVNAKRLKNKELQIIKISRQNKNKTKTKPDASKLLLNILV